MRRTSMIRLVTDAVTMVETAAPTIPICGKPKAPRIRQPESAICTMPFAICR